MAFVPGNSRVVTCKLLTVPGAEIRDWVKGRVTGKDPVARTSARGNEGKGIKIHEGSPSPALQLFSFLQE